MKLVIVSEDAHSQEEEDDAVAAKEGIKGRFGKIGKEVGKIGKTTATWTWRWSWWRG